MSGTRIDMDVAAVRFRMSGLHGRAHAIVESIQNHPENATMRLEAIAEVVAGVFEAVNFLLDRQMYKGSATPLVKSDYIQSMREDED